MINTTGLKELEDNVTYAERLALHKNSYEEVAEGLMILNKYSGRKYVGSEHDILYAGDSGVLEQMSEEDCRMMFLLGWHWSSEIDCWAR